MHNYTPIHTHHITDSVTFFEICTLRRPNRNFTKIDLDRKIRDLTQWRDMLTSHTCTEKKRTITVKIRRKNKTKQKIFSDLDWSAEVSIWLSLPVLLINLTLTIIHQLSRHAGHPPHPHKSETCPMFPKREDKTDDGQYRKI